ncbi:hypothetical protein PQG83_19470 [Candidatus Nitrospira neomarina]|uniref:Uncharacterized protein n=1 Tax=Candidatus Nitrospira neomarina TaxID=3020899 RepID=A0AA96GI51_9BACT|nr:hypothetical protein [Candidatus Nitrospira neomarina]WNM61898.1 hypothetical protein PQG83_19470 [Candidatus Nitrospira neomarina]
MDRDFVVAVAVRKSLGDQGITRVLRGVKKHCRVLAALESGEHRHGMIVLWMGDDKYHPGFPPRN